MTILMRDLTDRPVADRGAPAFEFFSRKWNPIIIWTLGRDGPMGFNELLDEIPNIAGKTLSRSLSQLEELKVIKREELSQSPLRVSYELTPAGEELEDIVIEAIAWGERHVTTIKSTIILGQPNEHLRELYTQWLAETYQVNHISDWNELTTDSLENAAVAVIDNRLPGGATDIENITECPVLLLLDQQTVDSTNHSATILRKPIEKDEFLSAISQHLQEEVALTEFEHKADHFASS